MAGFDVETVVEVAVVVFADAGVGPAAGLAVAPAVELVVLVAELAVAPGVAAALVVAPGVAVALAVAPGVVPAAAEPASCAALALFSR